MTGASALQHEPELSGQTVVVIGGSSGIGLETVRHARAEGADVILTGRHRDRLDAAAAHVGALRAAVFDATDPAALERFFQDVPQPVDHVMVTAGGQYYASLAEMDFARACRALDEHLLLPLYVGRYAAGAVRPAGTLVFMTGTAAGAQVPARRSRRSRPPRCLPTSRSSSRRSGSTSPPPGSSTRPCPRRCWAVNSTSAAIGCAPRCRSGGSSVWPTSPRSPCTS
jgi:NAD(P)-dependent dehydrogenase (short-subunit alcohol dehydrogenase family)